MSNVRLEVLAVIIMKVTVFCDVSPFRLEYMTVSEEVAAAIFRVLGEHYSPKLYYLPTTLRHTSGENNIHSYRREKPKSHT